MAVLWWTGRRESPPASRRGPGPQDAPSVVGAVVCIGSNASMGDEGARGEAGRGAWAGIFVGKVKDGGTAALQRLPPRPRFVGMWGGGVGIWFFVGCGTLELSQLLVLLRLGQQVPLFFGKSFAGSSHQTGFQGGSAGAFSLAAEGSGSAASQPELMVWCPPDIPSRKINLNWSSRERNPNLGILMASVPPGVTPASPKIVFFTPT